MDEYEVEESPTNGFQAPPIDPVPEGEARPRWSVMIPVYNCRTDLLEATLWSILEQDPGPDGMQLTLVDDASDDPRALRVAERLAPGRFEYHRQPRNVGLARNWNTCLRLSRGRWVHILHQDDLVRSGFYDRLGRADDRPEVGAAFCRNTFIDEDGRPTSVCIDGEWVGVTGLERETAGVLDDGWIERLGVSQRVHCPAIAVRREAYEQLGGFREDLVYVLDWEMWSRISGRYRVWFEPEPLTTYRVHHGSESVRLQHADDDHDVDDYRRGLAIIRRYVPPRSRPKVDRQARKKFADYLMFKAWKWLEDGCYGRGIGLMHEACRHDPSLRLSRARFGYYKQSLVGTLRRGMNRVGPPGPPEVEPAVSVPGADGRNDRQ